MELKKLDELYSIAIKKRKSKLAVAAAHDKQVLQAVHMACIKGIVEPILIGQEKQITEICSELNINTSSYNILHESDPVAACYIAVSLIKKGKADILMKGLVPTAPFLKAILHKETGIKKKVKC
jgi:phosphate butyryltransferase